MYVSDDLAAQIFFLLSAQTQGAALSGIPQCQTADLKR